MTDSIRTIFSRSHKTIAMAVLLIALFIAFITGSVIVKAGGSSVRDGEDKFYTNVTVEEGDTLWSIAENNIDYEHYEDIYDYMNELRRMNNMSSDKIYAGENLIVTYYSSVVE